MVEVKKSRVLFESDLRKLLDSQEPVDVTLRGFTDLFSGYLDGAVVSIFLYEEELEQLFLKTTSLRLSPGSESMRFTAGGTISSLAIGERRIVKMEEVDRQEHSPLQAGYYVFPLLEGDETLGVITIERVASRDLGVVQLDVARKAAGLISERVASAKKEAVLSQRMMKISAINEAGVTLVSHKELPELLKTSTAVTTLIMGAGSCIIRIYDEEKATYLPRDCYGLPNEDLRQRVLHLDRLVAEKVLERRKPLLVRDLSRGEEYKEFNPFVRTLISLPLLAGKDVVGTLSVFNKNTGNTFAAPYFTDEDLSNLRRLSKYIEKAVIEAMEHGECRELLARDEVTGLPDMKYFEPRLEAEVSRAGRFGSKIVVLACETSLRQHGDGLEERGRYRRLIRSVAEAIKGALRQYDIVAVQGEGQFVMILPQAEDGTMNAAVRVEVAVGKALEKFAESLEGALPEIKFTKVTFPDDGEDAHELLKILWKL